MALVGKFKKGEEGKTESSFTAEFTNGTVRQLQELANFLEKEGFVIPKEDDGRLIEVIKVGIAWLERIKSDKTKETVEKTEP